MCYYIITDAYFQMFKPNSGVNIGIMKLILKGSKLTPLYDHWQTPVRAGVFQVELTVDVCYPRIIPSRPR